MRSCVAIAAAFLASLAVAPVVLAQHEGHQMSAAPTGGGACAEHSRASLEIIDRAQRRLEESRQTNNASGMRAAVDDLQQALGELRTHQSLCVSAAAAETKSSEAAKPGASPGIEMTDHSKMPGMQGMDHSKMPGTKGMDQSKKAGKQGMDHSKMGQSKMDDPKMDHSKMGQEKPAAPKSEKAPSAKMDHSKMGQEKPAAPSAAQPQVTVDPVCGKEVATQAAEKATYQGKTYYFCSRADREKFLSDPAPYVNR